MKAGILLLRRASPCALARNSRSDAALVAGFAEISAKLGAGGFNKGAELLIAGHHVASGADLERDVSPGGDGIGFRLLRMRGAKRHGEQGRRKKVGDELPHALLALSLTPRSKGAIPPALWAERRKSLIHRRRARQPPRPSLERGLRAPAILCKPSVPLPPESAPA